MAGNKFDYLKMLYSDFGKKKDSFKNHTDSIQSYIEDLSDSVYEAARLYRDKYEGLRRYKATKPVVVPTTLFELEDTQQRGSEDTKELSDKLESVDGNIKAAINEIQYRYGQLNKVITSLSVVSANYKEIVNNIFDTWDEVITQESE